MRVLSSLDKAATYLDTQIAEDFGQVKTCKSRGHQKGDLLFFPRKKLKMEKINSKNTDQESRSWFIRERLEEKVTSLAQSTDISKEGITSGLRSAIIREPAGTYIRLKGVAPKLYETHKRKVGFVGGDRWGLVCQSEAYMEQVASTMLSHYKFPFISMKPSFVELFSLSPNKRASNNWDVQSQRTTKEKLRLLKEFEMATQNEAVQTNYSFVSASRISGDTRLDEAIYELTKIELSGKRKLERDELIYYLAFNAGVALASLNIRDCAWSGRLDATNSHLGNFILDGLQGKLMQSALCDLDSLSQITEFSSSREFWDHNDKDIELFRNDFFTEYTTSHPTSLKYKHFPEELRESSFQAFKTGYALILANAYSRAMNPSRIRPKKVIVPTKPVIFSQDFRDKVAYVLS